MWYVIGLIAWTLIVGGAGIFYGVKRGKAIKAKADAVVAKGQAKVDAVKEAAETIKDTVEKL